MIPAVAAQKKQRIAYMVGKTIVSGTTYKMKVFALLSDLTIEDIVEIYSSTTNQYPTSAVVNSDHTKLAVVIGAPLNTSDAVHIVDLATGTEDTVTTSSETSDAGRNGALFDPQDPDTLYVTVATGGVTENTVYYEHSAGTWTPTQGRYAARESQGISYNFGYAHDGETTTDRSKRVLFMDGDNSGREMRMETRYDIGSGGLAMGTNINDWAYAGGWCAHNYEKFWSHNLDTNILSRFYITSYGATANLDTYTTDASSSTFPASWEVCLMWPNNNPLSPYYKKDIVFMRVNHNWWDSTNNEQQFDIETLANLSAAWRPNWVHDISSECKVITWEGQLFVAGTQQGNTTAKVTIYNTSTSPWTPIKHMLLPDSDYNTTDAFLDLGTAYYGAAHMSYANFKSYG